MNRRRWLRLASWAAVGTATGLARIASATRMRAAPRVLVAGGGFAGAACALELRRLDPGIDVHLIDPIERYTTCPMSNEVIVGAPCHRSKCRAAGSRMLAWAAPPAASIASMPRIAGCG